MTPEEKLLKIKQEFEKAKKELNILIGKKQGIIEIFEKELGIKDENKIEKSLDEMDLELEEKTKLRNDLLRKLMEKI